MNGILCPDQKGQDPKAQLSASKVPVLAERRRISVGSSFRARFPHPSQLSSLREPGIQPNWSSASSGGPKGETRSHRSGRRPLLLGHREREQGEVHCSSRPGPWLVGGLGEGSGAFICASQSVPRAPQLTCWPKAGWAGGSPREGLNLPLLTLHLTTATPVTLG